MSFASKFVVCALMFVSYTTWADTTDINIAAIDWCPQICPEESKPGYVIDIINSIYGDQKIKLVIDYYPWSRAINYVRDGKYDALLSPAKPEAPDLIYPHQAIGSQQMCFFTKKDDTWRYTGLPSLANKQIGIASDTSIEELNQFVKDNPQQFQFQPYLERYVEQNFNKLKKSRMDTFLFTKNTTLWELNKMGVLDQVNQAGCVNRAPIYIAFSPKIAANKVAKLIKTFDSGIVTLHKSGALDEIFQRYGLSSETWLPAQKHQ